MDPSLVCVQDFAECAEKLLPKQTKDFYNSGACGESTLQNNEDAFQRLRIRPRVLVDSSAQDTKTKILGKEVSVPLGVSPTALQKLAHPDGEIANAKAVGSVGGIYILSTASTTSLEDVRKNAPHTTLWFQLYVPEDRKLTRRIVERAEIAGYEALVLTVDSNMMGVRYATKRNKFDLPPHLELANFSTEFDSTDKYFQGIYADISFDIRLSWEDVTWLKSITKLPIVLKGILTKEDAEIAVKYEVDAIMVSNHGGRQLDTSPATIEALPEIVKAVGGRIDVYIDGGIRFGTDILKSLALGAKMVFVGRPALWGLAVNGEEGVKKVLEILNQELKVAMALTGCQKIADIQRTMVAHESYYTKI